MRAVAVPFSPVLGAGGLVVPGDRVDVLVYTEYGNLFGPDEPVEPDSAAHATVLTLLQNVSVLAMDQSYAAPAGGDTSRSRATESTAQARTVTLAASPEDAQLLFLATQKGTLGLAMRRFGDNSEQPIEPEFRLRVARDNGEVTLRAGR
jgi:pilus assembly protein CpaB